MALLCPAGYQTSIHYFRWTERYNQQKKPQNKNASCANMNNYLLQNFSLWSDSYVTIVETFYL